jgi:hypothetical protein
VNGGEDPCDPSFALSEEAPSDDEQEEGHERRERRLREIRGQVGSARRDDVARREKERIEGRPPRRSAIGLDRGSEHRPPIECEPAPFDERARDHARFPDVGPLVLPYRENRRETQRERKNGQDEKPSSHEEAVSPTRAHRSEYPRARAADYRKMFLIRPQVWLSVAFVIWQPGSWPVRSP